jgi:hypothetical protein
MPTKFKIFAIAAALAAGTSSAAMAQDHNDGPASNPLSFCRAGYIYQKGNYCQRVTAAPRPCAPGYVYSLGYCYAAH